MGRYPEASVSKKGNRGGAGFSELDREGSVMPVELLEFGQSISWTMCRKHCCENCGEPYMGESPSRWRRPGAAKRTARTFGYTYFLDYGL